MESLEHLTSLERFGLLIIAVLVLLFLAVNMIDLFWNHRNRQ